MAVNSVIATITVAGGPRYLAATPDGTKVYVASTANTGTFSTISTATNTVSSAQTYVFPNSDPYGIAITPDGSKGYCTDNGTAAVQLIDTSANTIGAGGPSLSSPRMIAFSPDGAKAYVTERTPSTRASRVTVSSNSSPGYTAVGSAPHGVTFNPSGTKAYVANYSGSSLSILTSSTDTVTKTLSVSANPWEIAFTPDGTKAYVTHYNASGNVSVIDTSTETVTRIITGLGSYPCSLAMSKDGTKVYISNYNSTTVQVIYTATDSTSDTITVGNNPWSLAITPNGERLYVANTGSGTVSVIDISARTPFRLSSSEVTYSQGSRYGTGNAYADWTGMNDGNASGASGQTATDSGSTAWITVTLSQARDLDHIVLGYDYLSNLSGGWGVSYSSGISIQGSLDNATWTTLATSPSYAASGSSNGLVPITVAGKWRYIRLWKNSSYFPATEFQIWALPLSSPFQKASLPVSVINRSSAR